MPKSSTLMSGVPSGAAGQEEVGRLEVAVHDAERVRLGERLARLEDVGDRLVDGQRRRAPRRAVARSCPVEAAP